MDLSAVCKLDDNQAFYEKALKEHARTRATQLVGMLYLLHKEESVLAKGLLLKLQNVEATANLINRFPEIDALIYALHIAFARSDKQQLASTLNQLFLVLAPFMSNRETAPELDNFKCIPFNHIVHLPLLSGTVTLTRDMEVIEFIHQQLQEYETTGGLDTPLEVRSDLFTHSGIRVSVAAHQPSAAGQEFQVIEAGELPTLSSHQWIRQLLNGLALLDLSLVASMAQLMKLYTVVPRIPEMRQAGSVSSVPGWAWQDIDPDADQQEELCHVCVQMVHEFFHTKLYLVERNIPLYQGDGNFPELFSPWKDRSRPLRQVIHAMMTFSAGAAIWVKLLESPLVDSHHALRLGEEYCRKNLEFATLAQQTLLGSGALTEEGITLVRACYENLVCVTKPLLS